MDYLTLHIKQKNSLFFEQKKQKHLHSKKKGCTFATPFQRKADILNGDYSSVG